MTRKEWVDLLVGMAAEVRDGKYGECQGDELEALIGEIEDVLEDAKRELEG